MEFVSAGFNCNVAWFLKSENLRNASYPFDWIITPSDSFAFLASNMFDFDLLDIDDLKPLPACNRLAFDKDNNENLVEDIVTPMYNKRLRILFPHDFSREWQRDYPTVHNRYFRRMQRLNNLITSGSPVCFISAHPRFCMLPYRKLNRWQRKQFQISGGVFPRFKHSDILKAVTNLNSPNIVVKHLSEFKRA